MYSTNSILEQYSSLRTKYLYNNNILYDASLSGFDINNIINCFVITSITNPFSSNITESNIILQKLIFSKRYKINKPSNSLPSRIGYYYNNELYNSFDITYETNPSKDNRIESFTIQNYKYLIHYKP